MFTSITKEQLNSLNETRDFSGFGYFNLTCDIKEMVSQRELPEENAEELKALLQAKGLSDQAAEAFEGAIVYVTKHDAYPELSALKKAVRDFSPIMLEDFNGTNLITVTIDVLPESKESLAYLLSVASTMRGKDYRGGAVAVSDPSLRVHSPSQFGYNYISKEDAASVAPVTAGDEDAQEAFTRLFNHRDDVEAFENKLVEFDISPVTTNKYSLALINEEHVFLPLFEDGCIFVRTTQETDVVFVNMAKLPEDQEELSQLLLDVFEGHEICAMTVGDVYFG